MERQLTQGSITTGDRLAESQPAGYIVLAGNQASGRIFPDGCHCTSRLSLDLYRAENIQRRSVAEQRNGEDICTALPGFDDMQKRLIAATYGDLRVICAYVPNGEHVDSEKYIYKLEWLSQLNRFLQQQRACYGKVALLGDFNIAPEDRDVYDPEAWRGQVLCSEPERQAFRGLLDTGFVDSFHLFEQPEKPIPGGIIV